MKTRVLEHNLGIRGLGPLIGEVFKLVSTKYEDIKDIFWPARVSACSILLAFADNAGSLCEIVITSDVL